MYKRLCISAILILWCGAPVWADRGGNTLNVRVDFDNWGTAEQRETVRANLQAKLRGEWGADRTNTETGEVQRGVTVNVLEGGVVGPRDIQLNLYNTLADVPAALRADVGDAVGGVIFRGNFPIDRQAHVFPFNFTGPWLTTGLLDNLVTTANHEIGHLFCANDQNNRTSVDKMAQTWRRIDAAVGRNGASRENNPPAADRQAFADANRAAAFSEADRFRLMRNLNRFLANGGTTCASGIFGIDGPRRDTAVMLRGPLDVPNDPQDDEIDMMNAAITPGGNYQGFDLGFLNRGEDGQWDTADDWCDTKWFGERSRNYIEGSSPTSVDAALTLYNEAAYRWCLYDPSTEQVYSAEDYGELTFSNPVYNPLYGMAVYRELGITFDLDYDGQADVWYSLSADVTGIMTEGGDPVPAYTPNGSTTGFTPEPATLLLLAFCGFAVRRRGG